MKIEINRIEIGLRFRKDFGNLESLAKSMKELGQLQPIVITSNHKLISGGRRVEAAKILGWKKIDAKIIDIDCIAKGEHAENVLRKDFTNSELVEIGMELEKIEKQNSKQRQKDAGKKYGNGGVKLVENIPPATLEEQGKTRDIVALKIGFGSGKNYERAKAVHHYAKEFNKPEFIKKMDKKSINSAFNDMKIDERRKDILMRTDNIATLPDAIKFHHADFIEYGNQIEDDSVGMILSDPPYFKKDLYLYDELGKLASRVLKPGGFCAVYSGHCHLIEVMNLLSKHLEFYHQLIITYPSSSPMMQNRPILIRYKPIIIFFKSPINKKVPIFSNVIQGSGLEKDCHNWQQAFPEAQTIIDILSDPDDIILDPMAGSGTTLLAAYTSGRISIGIDIDRDNEKFLKHRLKEFKEQQVE